MANSNIKSLVVESDSEDECCFPATTSHFDIVPTKIKRNRDISDLTWSLCCRNCLQAVDGEGFCYCTHHENGPDENSQPEPPKKRKIEAVIDLTGKGKPTVIDFLTGKK